MAGSTSRVAALGLVALLTQGCVTGHFFDAARRREQPLTIEEAILQQDRLVLDYGALVTDDLGRPLGREERRVAIALADLRRGDLPPDAWPLERLASDETVPGRRLALASGAEPSPPAPFLRVEARPDGRPLRLVLHETAGAADPPLPANALTRSRTEPWVYAVLPLSLPLDAVVDSVGFVFLPVWLVVGD